MRPRLPLLALALLGGSCGQMYRSKGSPSGQGGQTSQPAPPAAPAPSDYAGANGANGPNGANSAPPANGADSWGAANPGTAPADPYGAAPPSPPAPPAPPTPPSPPAPPAPAAAATGTTAQRLVAAHNRVRAQHCAAPLTWSPKLAEVAQRWANSLRDQGCKFGHSGGQYGENLAAGTTGAMDPEAVVAMWADEVKGYSFQQPGFSMQTGHFTQVVWRSTTQVGCGMAQCNGNDIWVCNYDPPGNWEGQYKQEVLPAGCR